MVVLLISIGLFVGGYTFALATPDRELRLLFERLYWTGGVAIPAAWVVYALQYTGHGDILSRRRIALLSLPAVTIVGLVWTNPLHGLVWSEIEFVTVAGVVVSQYSIGPTLWLLLAYVFGYVLAGIALLLRLVFTTDHLFAYQGVAFLLGAAAPLLAYTISVTGLTPMPGLDLTPYSFTISFACYGYAFYGSDLFDGGPATRQIGRTAVVNNIHDGVVVVDDSDSVVDINPIAERQFGWDREDVLGERLPAAVDDPAFGLPEGEGTVVWSAHGPLEYEIDVSVLADQHGRRVGRMLVVRDVTDRTNRRQQLQVLNRVMRHNFRNDMNVINVCATQLADRLDGENAEIAERIRTVAGDLSETGTKAREIERIMSRRDNDLQPIDLPALVRRQVEAIRNEHPEATVETDLPEPLEIGSTGILESVLRNVLENAVVHNDGTDPWVRVTVDEQVDADTVEITVADNGPGIPRQERSVLVKGTETPLEHGSGLGLWLVHWGVKMLGGEVEFEDRSGAAFVDGRGRGKGPGAGEQGGSVVRLSIPRRRPITAEGMTERVPVDAD